MKKEVEELVLLVKKEVKDRFDAKKDFFASTTENLAITKTDLIKSLYFVGFAQFLAIVGPMLLMINFVLK